MNKTLPCATDYLACREARQVELYRYIRLEKMLKEALGASDAGDLEQKMLQARSQKRHAASTLIALLTSKALPSTRQTASLMRLKPCKSAGLLKRKLQ